MRKILCGFLTAGFIAGLLVSNADAQSYIGKQRTFGFSLDELAAITGNKTPGAGSLEEITGFVFGISVNELLKKARGIGLSPDITEFTLYVSGKKIRFDTHDQGNKMSHIMRLDEGKMYNIMWAQKQYMEMSIERMKQMQLQARAAVEKGMEGMLANMPPEARAQMEAAMGRRTEESEPSRLRKTGRKKTINGFPCEEYLVEGKFDKKQVWASSKFPAFRKAFEILSTDLPGFEGPGANDREWELWKKVPNAWPVVMKGFEYDQITFEPSLEMVETMSIEEKTLAPDTFRVPAGFSELKMEEIQQGIMRGRPKNR